MSPAVAVMRAMVALLTITPLAGAYGSTIWAWLAGPISSLAIYTLGGRGTVAHGTTWHSRGAWTKAPASEARQRQSLTQRLEAPAP